MADGTMPVLAPGPVYHCGYVVADIRESIRQWVSLAGAGPFVLFEDFTFCNVDYRGSSHAPVVTLAFAYSGTTCIELIQQHGDAPSIYSECRSGLHHIGIGCADIGTALACYEDLGMQCAFRGGFPFGGGCAYIDTRPQLGCFTELVEQTAGIQLILQQIRDLHAAWDQQTIIAKLST